MSDLISRQAAIDAECEVCQIAPKKERGHNCTYYVHGCKEIECLRALPSAEPEQVRTQMYSADCISRQAAIDIFDDYNVLVENGELEAYSRDRKRLCDLPSAQQEIIYCRECKFASGDSRICMKSGYSPIGELDFCAWAERRTDG